MATAANLLARLARLEADTPTIDGMDVRIIRFVDAGPDGGPVMRHELHALKGLGSDLSFIRGQDETEDAFIERAKSMLSPSGGLRVLVEA